MAHTHTCETAEEQECTCECGGRFHGIAQQTHLEEFECEGDAPLTPDEEAEMAELDRDFEEEEKAFRLIPHMIHAHIRELKRDGMSRETFYENMKELPKINEYMTVFDAQERI